MFRKFFLAIFLILPAAVVSASSALAAEEIKTFHSDITVNSDTSISIKETLLYLTSEQKHGIYRYIPIRYNRDGINYTARISNITVTADGQPVTISQNSQNGNIVLKIGDPEATFTRSKTYLITYSVENAVRQAKNANGQIIPELYWDITGEGWTIPVTASSATVYSPSATIQSVTCFSGPFGSSDNRCQKSLIDTHRAIFGYDQTINYGDNFTIAVVFDSNNGLVFPASFQKTLKQIQDNVILVPLFLPALIMLAWWWLRGRDQAFVSWNVFNSDTDRPQITLTPWSFRPTPMVYEPIAGLTPGEAGAILNERVNNQDVVAEIIELARMKLLVIKRLETKKLFGKNTDYQFTRTKKSAAGLTGHQKYLLDELFATGKSIKLSDIKGNFYIKMAKTKEMIYRSLFAKGLFRDRPQIARIKAFVVAIIALVATGSYMGKLLNQGV